LIIRRVVTVVSPEGKSEVVFDGDTPGYFDLAVSEFGVIWRATHPRLTCWVQAIHQMSTTM